MSYRDEARSSKAGKVSRILGSAQRDNSAAVMEAEGAKGTPPVKKAVDNVPVRGAPTKSRMDRPARARGGSVKKGKTNVTVIVAPQGGQQQSAPPVAAPVVPPASLAGVGAPAPASPVARPPMPPAPGPMAPGGMPMRKRGGAVMKAGAGSGVGRLEKL